MTRIFAVRIIRIALLSLFLSIAAAAPSQAGTIVADSGFRVNPDGFSFENYANDSGYANLNAVEMQRLFGDAVCLAGRGAECVLTPRARSWMENENASMGNGHCYGFSLLANLIHKGQLTRFGYRSIEAFGDGPNPFDLSIVGNRPLQGAIARAFATQTLPEVTLSAVWGRPTRMLNTLIKNLNSGNRESYQMGIFKRGFEGGHAITPYAVENMGDGIFEVHVYDNNWPGDDSRRLVINRKTDSWQYYASENPDRPEDLYEGDATTQTLFLKPTRASLGIKACPFCTGRRGGNARHNQVTISGPSIDTARLLITDRKGRRTGHIGNRFVNRIPGARIIHRTSDTSDTLEPIYLIPKKAWFKVRVSGRGLDRPVKQNLSIVGPTFDATVSDIRIKPGQVAHATLAPGRQRLTFGATTLDSYPEIDFGAQAKKASYRIAFEVDREPRGTKLAFTKIPRYGLLRVAAVKKNPRRFGVQIQRYSANQQASFTRFYRLRGKEQAYLAYGPLARPNGLARVVIGNPRNDKVRVLKIKKDTG